MAMPQSYHFPTANVLSRRAFGVKGLRFHPNSSWLKNKLLSEKEVIQFEDENVKQTTAAEVVVVVVAEVVVVVVETSDRVDFVVVVTETVVVV
ncbi:hypothetical protein Tco_1421228, partial [Tanacetum coccineum]